MGCASSAHASEDAPKEAGRRRERAMQDSTTTAAHTQDEDRTTVAHRNPHRRVPPILSPGADHSICHVREFPKVKDLMHSWGRRPFPGDAPGKESPRASARSAAELQQGRLVRCAIALLEIGNHPVNTLKYFACQTLLNSVDVTVTSRIMSTGHTSSACTDAADPDGRGVANLARCIDCLLDPVADIFESVFVPIDELSESSSRFCVRAIERAQATLFGCTGSFAALGISDGRGPLEQFTQAITNGFRVLYLAVGGTSGLVGNLGETGLPTLPNLDRIFMRLRGMLFDNATGEFIGDDIESSYQIAEFAAALRFFGLLPAKREDDWEEEYQSNASAMYNQTPFPFLSPAARRAFLALEFRVHRRRLEPPLTLPRIPQRLATLSKLIAQLASLQLIPRTMADFGTRSANTGSSVSMFAARDVLFADDAAASPVNNNLSFGQSPFERGVGLTAIQGFFHRASRLLTAVAGDSVNLRQAFGIIARVSTDIGLSIHLGHPMADHWEHLIHVGDIIELDAESYHVVEVTLTSGSHEEELSQAAGGLLGLVVLDSQDRVDLIVYLKRCDGADGDMFDARPLPLPLPEDDQSSRSPTEVWLRKKAIPLFVAPADGIGDVVRLNASLPELSPEGVAMAGASVTSRFTTSPQASPLKSKYLSRSFAENSSIGGGRSASMRSGHHVDTIVDVGVRRVLLETLQHFYFLGWLIGSALSQNQPIRVKLPVLVFRVLKTYRPTSTAMSRDASMLRSRDDFDPTASFITAGTTSPTAEDGQTPSYTCHFVPSEFDLLELGRFDVVERINELRELDYDDFIEILRREGLPSDLTREAYVRERLVEPNVLTPTQKVYLDAAFIALIDSGIIRSVVWQLSSPRELRDMCCA